MKRPQRKPLPTRDSSEKPSKLQLMQSQLNRLEAEMVMSSPKLYRQQSLANQELILRKLDALEERVKDLEIDEDDESDPDYPTQDDVDAEGGEASSVDDEDDIDLE